MGRYQVSTHSGEQVEVIGGNWLVALGLGLDALGVVANIDRLACEVLPGNTVIVRDVRAGKRFVVQSLPDDIDAPFVEIEEHPEDEEPGDSGVFAMGGDPDLVWPESDGSEPEDSEPKDSEPEELELSDDSDEEDTQSREGRSAEAAAEDEEDLDLSLFTIDSDADRGSYYHFSATHSDIVTLPDEEEQDPDADTDEQDASVEVLLQRLARCATTFDAWRMALDGACQVCGAESGAALRREEDGALRFLFAAGPMAHEVLGRRLPPGEGIAGFCTVREVGLLITEPRRDPRFFASMDQTTGYTTTTVLAVPVSTASEVLGCLELLNAPAGFQQAHLETLSILADGLADRLTVVG